jgi:uncharacterized protein (TIGR03083 family)
MLEPMRPVLLAAHFPALHRELMALLRGLGESDWNRPTVCASWSVKDIAAHLLDTSVRRLSFQRDRFRPRVDQPTDTYPELVAYLNRLNADWVAALRRVSPALLIELLELTGPPVAELFASLDPYARALFPVAWAGEAESANWFDVGREYTERWLHQQQIRDAVGAPGLTSRHWLHPALDLFVRALPRTYQDTPALPGSMVSVDIEGEAGGSWTILRGDSGWTLYAGRPPSPEAAVRRSQDSAWRLFSKGLTASAARSRVTVQGDQRLGAVVVSSLAIMA